MCGINGFVSERVSGEEIKPIVARMNARLSHRGPDNEGIWQHNRVCLGHRRLSIIDLSPESNQPFFSEDKRFVIVYNGELYNYRELKLELQRVSQGSGAKPHFFRTGSDTEVVLAAYQRWGNKCLDLFNGMFAFAIYDTVENSLFVARDRFGVKPLYYYYGEAGLLFSSELRPILHSGIKKFSINRDALPEYLVYQTVLAPATIVKEVKMLMPGHLLEYKNGNATVSQYYSPSKISSAASSLSYAEICAQVSDLLSLSVQRRLVADVPFGAFLSGGIDSSAVVGLMSKVSSEKIKTFNVSFDESDFSESRYARLIAKKFNTEHHEIKLLPEDFLKQLPAALEAMDHPGGDGPNTYIVSKATKEAGITMALSGIGGDELFAGYDVFKRMTRLAGKSWINAVPQPLRKTAGLAIRLKNRSVSGNKIAELLSQPKIDFVSAYSLSRSVFTNNELQQLIPGASAYGHLQQIVAGVPQIEAHLLSAVSLAEMQTYLVNTLLRDTDQMSMAVALEVREPFLDYRLIEFVLSIPDEHKFPHSPKKLLTDSLGDLLPGEIIHRPKMGFTLPWQHWLKHELRDFCEKNLVHFAKRNLCNEGAVMDIWNKFLAGHPTVSWSRVWHMVVLNNWFTQNADAFE